MLLRGSGGRKEDVYKRQLRDTRGRRLVLLLSSCSFLFGGGRRSVDDLDHREVADVQVELLPAEGGKSVTAPLP